MATKRTEAQLAAAQAAAYTAATTGAGLSWALFHESCSSAQIAKLDDWVSKGASPGLLVTLEGDAAPFVVRIVVVDSANQVTELATLDVATGRVAHHMH